MKNSQTSSPKHRVAAIMLAWPGHKFLVTCKNTHIEQSKQAFDTLFDFTVIVQRSHTEIWREVEKTIAAAEKPFTMLYTLFFERSPMFGGKRVIPADFRHGDFARSILNLCQFGANWMKSLSSQRRRQEVADAYKAFRENHEIIVTHE